MIMERGKREESGSLEAGCLDVAIFSIVAGQ
jgi:hypothetical protein